MQAFRELFALGMSNHIFIDHDHGDGSTDHFFSKSFGEVKKNGYLCKQ